MSFDVYSHVAEAAGVTREDAKKVILAYLYSLEDQRPKQAILVTSIDGKPLGCFYDLVGLKDFITKMESEGMKPETDVRIGFVQMFHGPRVPAEAS